MCLDTLQLKGIELHITHILLDAKLLHNRNNYNFCIFIASCDTSVGISNTNKKSPDTRLERQGYPVCLYLYYRFQKKYCLNRGHCAPNPKSEELT